MGKKKVGRSVKRNLNNKTESNELVQAPHSFVIHRGLSGAHTLELTKDFRKVMEPFTASSLKERKKNTIKDFVAIAGPLHVSHLSIFSKTELGMYLKIMRLPRGPTLTFKIHNYVLARDVVSSLKKQRVVEAAFKHSPLIILNSFSGEGLHLKLMASMFQNMFPTINITEIDLNNVRRCVLMNYDPTTKLIDFRHYNIKVAPVGISKGIKKVVQGKVPNLSKCNDITEFFTKSGIMSESEIDDPQNHIVLAQKMASRGNIESGKSAIRLSELGPRLTLQLIKIEDGLLDGEVLYHELIQKTEEEKEEIQQKRAQKRKLKEKRKKIQETNKKAKEEAKQQLKEQSLQDFSEETGVKRKRESSDYNGKKPKLDDTNLLQSKNKFQDSKNKFKDSKNKFQDSKSKFKDSKNKFQDSKSKFQDSKNKFQDSKNKFKESKNKFKNVKRGNAHAKNKEGNKFNKKVSFIKKGKNKINFNRDQRPIGQNSGMGGKKRFKKSKN